MAGLVRSGPVDSTAVQSSTPVSIAFKDNSNPQQGSMIGARSGPTRTDDHSGSRATVPMASATAQVGRPSLKIPPHRKDARKLFVGGLPVDITEDEFRTFFQRFGKLIDCIVMVDRDTNRSRGFGFVSYEDPEVAKELLAKGNDGRQPSPESDAVGRLEMRGKMIEIKAAQPRDVAPNRRHYNNRSMDQRRQSSSTPSVPSMGADHNAMPSAFAPAGYEYASPTYYPYLYPPATSSYMSSGYYQVMSSSASSADITYPTSFAPTFGYDVSAAYSPYHNYQSHPYATSASASSPPHLQVRKPLLHTSSPGAGIEETSASTGAV